MEWLRWALLWSTVIASSCNALRVSRRATHSAALSSQPHDEARSVEKEYEESGTEDFVSSTMNNLTEAAMRNGADDIKRILKRLEETDAEVANLKKNPRPASEEACDRDYGILCPTGWTQEGSTDNWVPSRNCVAPDDYFHHSCHEVQNFAISKDEKIKRERECAIRWPCKVECERAYSLLCPEGWLDIGAGNCRANYTYSDRCKTEENFGSMSEEEKKGWAAECNAEWPCEKPAETDYTAPCPDGWAADGPNCVAPSQYGGSCGPKDSLGELTKELKMEFEKRCGVKWPEGAKCGELGIDYNAQICPLKWTTNIDTETCEAPEEYIQPCERSLSMADLLTVDDRIRTQRSCGVHWPCKVDCIRNYARPCPINWVRSGQVACRASSSYEGPCNGMQRSLQRLNAAEKASFARQCNVVWPCIEDVAEMLESFGIEGKKGQKLVGVAGPVIPKTGRILSVVA